MALTDEEINALADKAKVRKSTRDKLINAASELRGDGKTTKPRSRGHGAPALKNEPVAQI